jgi:integrase
VDVTSYWASVTKKLRSKYWFACFRDLHGRQHRRSTGQIDRKKALEVARHYELVAQRRLKPQRVRETLAELYRRIYGESVPTATLRNYVTDWLAIKEHEAARASIVAYRKSADKFIAYLGTSADLDIADIRQPHITGFRNDVAKRLAPQTANFDLKCIKTIFRAARRDGYLLENPAEFVDTVRRESGSKRRPFTVSEIQAILSVADPEWQSLIKFGLYTGQRLTDLASLTWSNIDLQKNQIRLVARKTGKNIIIPIAAPLRAHILAVLVSVDPKTPLHSRAFATLRRQKGNAGNLSNQFSQILAAVGLREPMSRRSTKNGRNSRRARNELSFHCLRHTAVTLLKDAGIPEAVVMELVGHDSEQMSAHYTHVGQEALEKATAALPVL